VTEDTSTAPAGPALHAEVTAAGGARPDRAGVARRYWSWIPTWGLIATKHLELRKRRGLIVVIALLTVGLPVLVLGLRLLFHLFDPKSYGPAGTPGVFQTLCNPMAEFGFIVAATLGAAAGTTDLADGMFRHLVITGRSRIALYLARVPAGLSIVLPLVAVAFTMLCLVTSYAGTPQPASVNVNGINMPAQLSEAQLKSWLLQHPGDYGQAFISGPVGPGVQSAGGPGSGPPPSSPAQVRQSIDRNITTIYGQYFNSENGQLNPAVNEMVKIGLWLELEVGIGFLVGLGLGSLTGQRTLSTVLMIVLEIIVTPILARTVIPYFINGQRLVVGVAMDQLRPAGLATGEGGGGPGHVLFGGRGSLGIPPMPTWAMITVIVGWIVGWSVIGAWRMATRDA
jgi:hypothetical protein